jgi:hypothetical protein
MPESKSQPSEAQSAGAAEHVDVLPSQIAAWQQQHFSSEPVDGQWLNALKDTSPGDRMIVAEAQGRGLVLVVDFDSEAQPANGGYYAWGACTLLEQPVPLAGAEAGVFRESRGPGVRWL